jgi:4-hydroxythreonine-4-phosphate dehydrogenase
MKANPPLVAITMGDPVGIGPEIIAKALADPRVLTCCQPVIYGDASRLNRCIASTGTTLIRLAAFSSLRDSRIVKNAVRVIDPTGVDTRNMAWGKPCSTSGKAMVAYLNSAIDDAMAGRVSAIVTGPINKSALKMADIHFSGHTEILAQRTGTRDYAMMLAGDRLKVVLATIHLPIKHLPGALTTERIAAIVALTDHALKSRFGLNQPRIAVAGLNPHAGESGLFGDEEEKIITPAIGQAVSQGIDVSGPHPPDTVFFRASRGVYDAVVAMYHDQGLGPFKMIHFADGVNTTLGLPIIRTSVDHGTAYDIAGSGKASSQSMVAAITMAANQVRLLNRESPDNQGSTDIMNPESAYHRTP